MRKIVLIIGLFIAMYSCGPCCDNTDVSLFTKYYIGDSCVIAEYGIYIKEKEWYETLKSECDEIKSVTIYQEDFIKDTFIYEYKCKEYKIDANSSLLVPYDADTLRYLEFNVDDNFIEGVGNIIHNGKNLGKTRILKTIDISDIDSIIFEDYWFYD